MKKRSLSDCQHVTESFLIENMDEMIVAAREGRLLLMPKDHKQPKREDVLNSVRAYVSEIECFARRWRAYLRLPRNPSDFLEIRPTSSKSTSTSSKSTLTSSKLK